MTRRRTIAINGTDHMVSYEAHTPLAAALRAIGLTSVKLACERGECGSCTVLVAGRPVMACMVLVSQVNDDVRTAEGLAMETADLRAAFADEGAFQCGFCTPGVVVHAAALLRNRAGVSAEEFESHVRTQLSGNICRCTGYRGIVAAVCKTAVRRDEEEVPS